MKRYCCLMSSISFHLHSFEVYFLIVLLHVVLKMFIHLLKKKKNQNTIFKKPPLSSPVNLYLPFLSEWEPKLYLDTQAKSLPSLLWLPSPVYLPLWSTHIWSDNLVPLVPLLSPYSPFSTPPATF